MPKASPNTITAKAWHATAAELARQNRPVELVPLTEAGVELPRVRARLLSVDADDGSFIVEKSGSLQQAEALGKGVAVDVYLVSHNTRMQARSKIIDLGWFKLNKQTKVMAVRLEPVTDIASAQRRACFRLPTSAMGITAELCVLDDAPGEQTVIEGQVLDLSDRGLGVCVRLESEAAQQMKDQLFAIHASLPGQNESLDLEARLVRVIKAEGEAERGEGLTFGFQFEFRNFKEQRRVEQVIQQFSVTQQRKQLQRMRGVG